MGDILAELKLDNIDLISMNIEGGEYPLMTDILENNLTNKFKNIQIQFHEIDETSEVKRLQIREHLKLTHRETFCFPFVWENWERIDCHA